MPSRDDTAPRASLAAPPPLFTDDRLFDGARVLFQLPKGHNRTTADALFLAAFAADARPLSPARLAVDLGAGVGPIAIGLLHCHAAHHVLLVENDLKAAALAEKNLEANGWAHQGTVLGKDVREAATDYASKAQLVVCNPPYFEPGTGRLPAGASRHHARMGPLSAFVASARHLLGSRGKACFIYPAREFLRLATELRKVGLEPKRLRAVHPTADAPARVVMVEAMAGKPGGLHWEAPLLERAATGYTDEARAIFSGNFGSNRKPHGL